MKKSKEIIDFVERIKKSGLSVRKIASSVGIPEQRIYGWTIKDATPGYDDIQLITSFLDRHDALTNNNFDTSKANSAPRKISSIGEKEQKLLELDKETLASRLAVMEEKAILLEMEVDALKNLISVLEKKLKNSKLITN